MNTRSFPLFGLTGGVATGKSAVAGFFAACGACIINADKIGHELLRRPGAAYEKVVSRFGSEVLGRDGEIDRRRLGAVIFADAAKRLQLNAILHPEIIARQEDLARKMHRENPQAVILIEAALIYEAGVEGRFTRILATCCRSEQQMERLRMKAGISEAEARARIAAQMPLEEKSRRADFVIDCSRSLEYARAQVEDIYPKLQNLFRSADDA